MDNRVTEQGTTREVRAKRLVIVDGQDRERIVLTTNRGDDGNPQVHLMDVHGNPRVSIYLAGRCGEGINATLEIGPANIIHDGALLETNEPRVEIVASREAATVGLCAGAIQRATFGMGEDLNPSLELGDTELTPEGLRTAAPIRVRRAAVPGVLAAPIEKETPHA